MSDTAPLERTYRTPLPNVPGALDDEKVIAVAPITGAIIGVSYTPDQAITGAAPNTRRFALVNRGQDGAGTTVIAELRFDPGVSAAAFVEAIIPLAPTEAARAVVAGDVVSWLSESVGTGLPDPGGSLLITMRRA